MALARAYKVGVFDTATPLATGATVTTTTPTPILFGVTVATGDCNISAVRVNVLGAAAFPSNASVLASINIVTGTQAGGNAAVSNQLSGVALASNTTFLTAGGTSAAAITRPTPGEIPWAPGISFTPRADWGEGVTPRVWKNNPRCTKIAMYTPAPAA